MSNIVELHPKPRTYGADARIGIVIQARMTSKRFPGKVLAMLDGKPVIQHVVERCRAIRGPVKVTRPIKVVVAVPDTDESEPLLNFVCNDLGVDNFCGSEDNVLERYMGAANFFKFDVILRITADCPLIDPIVCSEVLQLLMWRKMDYTSNSHEDRTFPKGLDCEAFTYDCLEYTYIMVKNEYNRLMGLKEAGKLANFDPDIKQCLYDMEHVTPYMIRNRSVNKALVKRVAGDSSHQNWCVDVPEDIGKIERLLEKIRGKNKKHEHPKDFEAPIIKVVVSNDN